VNSVSRADNAASILWTSFKACTTSLEVAFTGEVTGLSDAFSLPLLLPEGVEGVEGADADGDAEAGAAWESASEARIAWIVSRTSDAYSLLSRDSRSAFRDDSVELVGGFHASGVVEVFGLACD
jgi:hypothetical protein